jgi:hypothetical protein
MSTRKKKTDSDNQSARGWPRITEGSHLTVIEHENGRRELIWDDDALMRDVRAAILKAESTIPVAETNSKRPRRTTKK